MQSIQEYWLKIKVYLEAGIGEWGIVVLVVLIAIACFGLGRLSVLASGRPPMTISQSGAVAQAVTPGGMFIASRRGETYYYPWCGGAQSIQRELQVWFTDEEAAQAAGYRPAKNCKGLASSD